MPNFSYTARDMSGKSLSGTLEAANERDVASILSERSQFPVSVKEIDNNAAKTILGNRKKVKGQTMAMFYSQMSSLLRAGVPMIRSLNVLSQQSSDPVLKEVVGEIRTHVEDGETVGDAMAKFPNVFNEMACNMAVSYTHLTLPTIYSV